MDITDALIHAGVCASVRVRMARSDYLCHVAAVRHDAHQLYDRVCDAYVLPGHPELCPARRRLRTAKVARRFVTPTKFVCLLLKLCLCCRVVDCCVFVMFVFCHANRVPRLGGATSMRTTRDGALIGVGVGAIIITIIILLFH